MTRGRGRGASWRRHRGREGGGRGPFAAPASLGLGRHVVRVERMRHALGFEEDVVLDGAWGARRLVKRGWGRDPRAHLGSCLPWRGCRLRKCPGPCGSGLCEVAVYV